MKYTVTAIVIVALVAPVCMALGCGVAFYGYPDGSVHECVIWTGDPNDDGEFEVVDEVFRNVTGGSAHYIVDESCCYIMSGVADLQFFVEGTNWDFAWNITMLDPRCGTCLRLSHGECDGVWRYTLSEFAWEIPEGATPPETAFTWHVGVELRSWHAATPGPLLGWHTVQVWYYWPQDIFTVYVDGQTVFYRIGVTLADGTSYGFGCTASEAGTSAFEYLEVNAVTPVEDATWGSIKSLYRTW